MNRRFVRMPSFLAKRIEPGKLEHKNAVELMKLLGQGKLTAQEVRFYVEESGLHPRMINSHIRSLKSGEMTPFQMIQSAVRAFESRIPNKLVKHARDAPIGKFYQRIYLDLLRNGYRPPYNFIWNNALLRVERKNSQGNFIYPDIFRKRFTRGYWKYHKGIHNSFKIRRKIKLEKELGHQTAALEEDLRVLEKKIIRGRRILARMLRQM